MELAALEWDSLLPLAACSLTNFSPQFPITRDFPWANLLLFSIGATLLLVDLSRAFGRTQVYRGKNFATRYDVLHRGGWPKNNDVARPAEFYVDANGTVQWVNLTETIAVRATGTSIERHRCDEGWPGN